MPETNPAPVAPSPASRFLHFAVSLLGLITLITGALIKQHVALMLPAGIVLWVVRADHTLGLILDGARSVGLGMILMLAIVVGLVVGSVACAGVCKQGSASYNARECLIQQQTIACARSEVSPLVGTMAGLLAPLIKSGVLDPATVGKSLAVNVGADALEGVGCLFVQLGSDLANTLSTHDGAPPAAVLGGFFDQWRAAVFPGRRVEFVPAVRK